MKVRIANILFVFGITRILFFISRIIYGNHIRVINYHGTSLPDMLNFEEHLRFYSKYYQNVNYNDLNEFFASDKSFLKKPGLIISFDDGHRSNYENALPLLEKYGFTAWLMVPPGPIDFDLNDQKDYVGSPSDMDLLQFPDGRLVMNWEELQKASESHVIGCHTYTHHRMRTEDDATVLDHEIYQSKKKLESRLNRNITIFCWVGGEGRHYTKSAAKQIKDAGYTYSFLTNTIPIFNSTSPLQISRTNIEVNNSFSLVLFQLSGLMDVFYYPKYKRINRITSV